MKIRPLVSLGQKMRETEVEERPTWKDVEITLDLIMGDVTDVKEVWLKSNNALPKFP